MSGVIRRLKLQWRGKRKHGWMCWDRKRDFSNKEANVHFGRKMNKDVSGNRKMFWKGVGKAKSESKTDRVKTRSHVDYVLRCEVHDPQ